MVETVISLSEFMRIVAKPENVARRFEFDGERIIEQMPTNPEHGDILAAIIAVLYGHRLAHGGRVTTEGNGYLILEKAVNPDGAYIPPDRTESIATGPHNYILTPPALVVEVLSPSTEAYDSPGGWKFSTYDSCTDIQEYWIVDPIYHKLEVFIRDGDSLTSAGIFRPGSSFNSPALGRLVAASEIFGDIKSDE